MRDRDESGVAVVLVLALVAGLMVLAAIGVGVSALVSTHRRAQAAADLAALAAAQALRAGADPCAGAARIASANDAAIEACTVAGSAVEVTVAIRLPTALGGQELRALARAGPPGG